jgi:competence protein ComEC
VSIRRVGGPPRSAWLAIGAAAGALASTATRPIAVLLLAMAAIVVAGALRRSSVRRGRLVGGPLLALGLGVLAIGLRVAVEPATVPRPAPSGDGPWVALVTGVGTPRDGSQSATLAVHGPMDPLVVAATLPRYPDVVPGDMVRVDGRIEPPPDDGYGSYLRRIGAVGTLRSRKLERIVAAPPVSVDAGRRLAGDALRAALPEPEAGLAAGILIGLRERVDRDLAADFTTAGASHVVAISGWNIALVAGLVAGLLRGRGTRARLVLMILAIGAYTVAAGGSASVLRAAVMAGVVLVARASGRGGRAAAALGWAAALLLVVDPRLIADAGFELSVVATAGLLAWASPLTRWLDGALGGRIPGWLAESLGVSLAAQAATLPIVLGAFGRLSLIAPLVNLAVVPLVPLAMAAGVLAMAGGIAVLAGAPQMVATVLGLPAWLSLTLMVGIVRAGAAAPLASIDVPPEIAGTAGVLAAVALGAVVAARRRARTADHPDEATTTLEASQRTPARQLKAARRVSLAVAALGLVATTTLALGGVAVAERMDRASTLTVLDVGQGDAILLQSVRGTRMLVDGGPDPDRLLVALDERIPAWDRRLDVVVLTHPHEDHVAGLAVLLRRYTIGRVLEPGMHGPGPGWAAWDAALAGRRPPRATIGTGGHLQLDEIGLTVLWPDAGAVPIDPPDTGTGINNVSIVLLGQVGARRFLLAGDIEQGIDPILLGRGLPRVDVLKVAHHGSATASTQAFLDAVRPSVAIASAGAGNPYGHPAPSTLARLREHGARVYHTDKDGTVEIRFGPDGIRTAASGRRAARGARVSLTATRPGPRFGCSVRQPGAGAGPAFPTTAPSSPTIAELARMAPTAGYHRLDDARSDRGCPDALLARSPGVVRASRRGRGRDRRVACAAGRRAATRRGSPRGRGGRAPP